MDPRMKDLVVMRRNDLPAVIEWVRLHGEPSAVEWRVLWGLQDAPRRDFQDYVRRAAGM